MKKISILLMSILLLSGCGGNEDKSSKEETTVVYSADEDSDYDGIDDLSEVEEYKTDPLNEDTDGDGVDDLYEINIGSNPCVADELFEVTLSSEEVTQYNLVSAEVSVKVDSDQMKTVDLYWVSTSDNFMVRSSLPGYMGTAYCFSVDGEISDAKLTFRYNTDEYPEINEGFQPRLYYIDDTVQRYIEVENQNVEHGVVQATVNQAGTYILLNKIEHDEVWN